MQKTLILFLACLLWVGKAYAQKETNIWFVSDGYGIEFQKGKFIERHDSKMNTGTLRGNITLCDSTGKLQFYSDGISIWNSKNQVIAKDLHGELNISAVPYTNKQGVYLLFHTGRQENPISYPLKNQQKVQELETKYLQEVEKKQKAKLYYSMLDMNEGKFLEKDVLVLENALSDFCIARHAEAGKYWLIAHEGDSDKFLAYLIDEKGLTQKPIITSIGAVRTSKYDYIMKTTLLGNRFLMDKVGVDTGFEVYDFDNATGKPTQCYEVQHADKTFFVWSYEFSPRGRYLYSSFHEEGEATDSIPHGKATQSLIYQYDLKYFEVKNNIRVITKPPLINWQVFNNVINKDNYGGTRTNSNLQLAINGWIWLPQYKRKITVFLKPNQRLRATKGDLDINILDLKIHPYKFGGKMPKITHLLPLSLLEGSEEIIVGKPFTREILFDTNQAILKPEYEAELQDILAYLKENPKTTLEISGHTDNEGEESKNKTLSEARAQVLANFLIKNNIGKERIKAVGYGSSKPIAENTSPEGKAKNRRIEFLVK